MWRQATQYKIVSSTGTYESDGTTAGMAPVNNHVATFKAAAESFPTTGLLDDFNRANSTALGSAWTELGTGLEISSNRLIRTGSGLAYWNAAKFTDCEVYARLGVVNSNNAHYLGWRVALAADRSQDPTTVANWSGYYLDVNPGLDRIRVYRYNGGSDTQIGSDITVTGLAVDDLVGVQMSGSAIKVFHKPAAGSWAEIRSDSNSTYTDAGRLTVELGAGSNHAWDDYSGGAVVGFPDGSLPWFKTT